MAMMGKQRLAQACLAVCLLASSLEGCASIGVTISRDPGPTAPPTPATRSPNLVSNPVPTPSKADIQSAGSPIPVIVTSTSQALTPEPAPTPLPTAEPTTSATTGPTFEAQNVDQMIASLPAHVGIVVALPDGTTLYQRDADTMFESASLYKLAIMAEIYRQRDAGTLTFDDLVTLYPGFFLEDDSVYGYDPDVYNQVAVGTLLDNMITLSSNVAATALLYVAGTDNVNAMAASLGMSQTRILWYPETGADLREPNLSRVANTGSKLRLVSATASGTIFGWGRDADLGDALNVTTPGDVARFFEALVQGTVVSPQDSVAMLNLLGRQQINDRLPALLPDGTRVAHKTGDLDNSVHDAGVIYAPDSPVIVSVLTDEVENRQAVVDFIQQVAQLAFEAGSR